jgi:hypothetical protein
MIFSRPPGGKLINGVVEGDERERLLDQARSLFTVMLHQRLAGLGYIDQ